MRELRSATAETGNARRIDPSFFLRADFVCRISAQTEGSSGALELISASGSVEQAQEQSWASRMVQRCETF
jgi:hypothetical protein